MYILSLQSGSNGNCVYIEGGGVRLLVDAGISGQIACARLAQHGRDIRQVDAVLISHDHSDHSRSMGIFHRKFGLPIYATKGTFAAAKVRCSLGRIDAVREFTPGEAFHLGQLRVETIPTPHDGTEGVAFVLDDGHQRIGILTDLGHVFSDLVAVVGSLDGVLLESNYDPDMLAKGSYPAFLKGRIRGPHGHLSNLEAAELVATSATQRLQWVCLAHLSEQNNTPTLALQIHREVLGERLPVQVASRYQATPVLQQ